MIKKTQDGKLIIERLSVFYTGCGTCKNAINRSLTAAGVPVGSVSMLSTKVGDNRAAAIQYGLHNYFPEIRGAGNFGALYNPENRRYLRVYGQGVSTGDQLTQEIQHVYDKK